MNLKRQNLIGILIWGLISFVEWIYLNCIDDYSYILIAVSWLTIFNLITQIIIWVKCNKNALSPFMAFVYCCYIFHFGQIIMTGLFSNVSFDYINYVTVYMINHEVTIKTITITVNCINLLFLGGIFSAGLTNNRENVTLCDSDKDNSRYEMFRIAKILFWISFPFRIFIDVQELVAAFVGGYYSAIAVNYSGIVDCIAGFWYSAVVLYYIGLDNENQKKKFFIFIILYLVIIMLTGNRGHQIVCLLMLFIVAWAERERKFNFKILIIGLVAIYVGLVLIDVIYSMRESGIHYFFSNLGVIIEKSSRANILFETIGSFGETIFTPYLVIQGFNSGSIDPGFGECFYKSLVSILPSIGSTMAEINKQANFVKMLGSSHAIGGSIVGEMYYNFRCYYGIFSVFVGIILGRISSTISEELINKKYSSLLYNIPIMTNLIWWSRDSISNAIRIIVWICVLIWVLRRVRHGEKL